MTLVWRNETVISLIELYQSYEYLWDTSKPDYRNRVKKHEAWEDIAKIMELPRKEIEGKMHNLRSQFTRERKKIMRIRKTSGTGEEATSQWFAYDAMKFLLKEEATSDTLDIMEEHSSQSQDMNSTSPDEEGSLTFQSVVQEFHSPAISDPVKSQSHQQASRPSSSRTTRKRTLMQHDDDRLEDAYEDMDAPKHRRISRDEFDIYGQYVGSELRSLNDEHSTIMAKHYINNILTDARLGKYRQSYRNSTKSPTTFKRDSIGF